MASLLPQTDKIKLLDLATGTGDQLLSLMKNSLASINCRIDLAENMLKIGQKKLKAMNTQVTFKTASAMPFLIKKNF